MESAAAPAVNPLCDEAPRDLDTKEEDALLSTGGASAGARIGLKAAMITAVLGLLAVAAAGAWWTSKGIPVGEKAVALQYDDAYGTNTEAPCVDDDEDLSLADAFGSGCASFVAYPSNCQYSADDEDFSASLQCCACKGVPTATFAPYDPYSYPAMTTTPGGGPCATHGECGDGQFCFYGTCSACSQCYYCYDGYDHTCGTCTPLYGPECSSGGYVYYEGTTTTEPEIHHHHGDIYTTGTVSQELMVTGVTEGTHPIDAMHALVEALRHEGIWSVSAEVTSESEMPTLKWTTHASEQHHIDFAQHFAHSLAEDPEALMMFQGMFQSFLPPHCPDKHSLLLQAGPPSIHLHAHSY